MARMLMDSRGISIIGTVLTLITLGIMGAALVAIVASEQETRQMSLRREQSFYAVQAGLEYALREINEGGYPIVARQLDKAVFGANICCELPAGSSEPEPNLDSNPWRIWVTGRSADALRTHSITTRYLAGPCLDGGCCWNAECRKEACLDAACLAAAQDCAVNEVRCPSNGKCCRGGDPLRGCCRFEEGCTSPSPQCNPPEAGCCPEGWKCCEICWLYGEEGEDAYCRGQGEGQDEDHKGCLGIDVSGVTTGGVYNNELQNIVLTLTCMNAVTIDQVTASWEPDFDERVCRIAIGGVDVWSCDTDAVCDGNCPSNAPLSGDAVDISDADSSITTSSPVTFEIEFSGSMVNKDPIDIIFTFTDSSCKVAPSIATVP